MRVNLVFFKFNISQVLIFLFLAASSCNINAITKQIEEKLIDQFRLYDHAKNHLIQEVGRQRKVISREQWEKLLRPTRPLSTKEILQLKKEHANTCYLNAQKSRRE